MYFGCNQFSKRTPHHYGNKHNRRNVRKSPRHTVKAYSGVEGVATPILNLGIIQR